MHSVDGQFGMREKIDGFGSHPIHGQILNYIHMF
jgi:hypothetical protein